MAAMPNCAIGAQWPSPKKAVHKLIPASMTITAHATTNGNGRARFGWISGPEVTNVPPDRCTDKETARQYRQSSSRCRPPQEARNRPGLSRAVATAPQHRIFGCDRELMRVGNPIYKVSKNQSAKEQRLIDQKYPHAQLGGVALRQSSPRPLT